MARLIIRQRKGKHDKKEAEYYTPDETKDFFTEHGAITKEQLQKGGTITVGNQSFTILPITFMDQYTRLKRGAQVVQPKDLGMIVATTGLGKNSMVLDIGAGSGWSAILFSRVAKQVATYDVAENSVKLTTENVHELGIDNVTVQKGDASKPDTIKEKDIDLFFLDLPEPWKALETAKKVLKPGAWLVGYTPTIPQATRLAEALDDSFIHVKTVEIMERDWKVHGQAIRAESKDFQHTAFLSFIRKV